MMSQYQTLGGEGSVATFATRDESTVTPASRVTPRRGGGRVEEAIRFYEERRGGGNLEDGGEERSGFPSQRATSPARSSSSSLPNAAPDLSFEDEEERAEEDARGGRCLDVTIDPAGFSGADSDFGPPASFDGADGGADDDDDDEPSFLRRARASPPSSDAGGSGASRNMRRSRRPWDEIKDESTMTDGGRDDSLQGRLGASFVSVNMTRASDRTGSDPGGAAAAAGGVLLGSEAVDPTPIMHRSKHPPAGTTRGRGQRPSPAEWDRSDEATPLLGNNNPNAGNGNSNGAGDTIGARGLSRGDTNTNSLSEVASSWATGASMRFRDPLHRRRDFFAAPAGASGASPSWSGGLISGRGAVDERGGDEDDDDSKGRRDRGLVGAARGALAAVRGFVGWRNRGGVVVGTSEGGSHVGSHATGCGGCGNLGEAFFDLLRQEDMATAAAAAAAAASKAQRRPRFSRILSALLVIHFGAMALFDLILLLRSAVSSGLYDAPPLWLGAAGLAYNPLVGPSSSTLAKFGAAGPALVLLKSQPWRLITSATLSTSLTQLLLNLYTARTVLLELERRIGPSSAAGIYAASTLVGGVWSSALRFGMRKGATAEVTGLASAGIAGLLAACLVEMGLGSWGESIRRRRSRGACGWLPRPGMAHALLLLSFLPCPFPYGSLSSALGGVVAGLGCGTFLFASLARGPRAAGHHDDWTQQGGGDFDDGARSEALFEPVGTPVRRLNYRMMHPPPPPDSSPSAGRGMTPRMRRSILASPGADADEREMDGGEFAYGDASSPLRDVTSRGDEEERGAASGVARMASAGGRNCVPLLRLAGLALALQAAALPPLLLATGAVQPIAADEETVVEELQGGCRYLKRLHPAATMWTDLEEGDEASADGWACSESCVPLGLVRRAAGRQTWSSSSLSDAISSSSAAASTTSSSAPPRWGIVRAGRCSDLGYRCGPTTSYELYLGSTGSVRAEAEAFVPPGSDGTCP